MTRDEWKEKVKNGIIEALGDYYEINEQNKYLNNGEIREGFCIHDPNYQIAPVIYYDDFMSDFRDGVNIEQTIDKIIDYYEAGMENMRARDVIARADFLLKDDFEAIKDKIVPVLINRENNLDFLNNVPHTNLADLAVIYKISISDEDEVHTTLIRNSMAHSLGVDVKELHEIAVNNLSTLGAFQSKLMEVFDDFYVVSNKTCCLGAAAILNRDFMEIVQDEVGENLVLLPSSIHEFIVLNASEGFANMDYDALRNMVRDANGSVLSPEDILSYNVYTYRDNEVELAPDTTIKLAIGKEYCSITEDKLTGKEVFTFKIPQCIGANGKDISGYVINPNRLYENKENKDEMIAEFDMKNLKNGEIEVKNLKEAKSEIIDIIEIKDAIDTQKEAYNEVKMFRESMQNIKRKEKDLGEELY